MKRSLCAMAVVVRTIAFVDVQDVNKYINLHFPPLNAPLSTSYLTMQIWPIDDVPGYPIIHAFPSFVALLERVCATYGVAIVHCANGVSRSAAVVAAYLMRSKKCSAAEAYKFIKQRRSKVSERKFLGQVELWGALGCPKCLRGSSEEHTKLKKYYSIKRIQKMKACLSGKKQTDWPATSSSSSSPSTKSTCKAPF